MENESGDVELPQVIAEAWRSIKETYGLEDLDGPADEEILGRKAKKWYTTAETDEDLVSIDLYVLEGRSTRIPGIGESVDSDGTRHYYRTGQSVFTDPRGAYAEITLYEVEALRPSTKIKVVLGSMVAEKEFNMGVGGYKNTPDGIEKLTKVITDGLNAAGVSPIR